MLSEELEVLALVILAVGFYGVMFAMKAFLGWQQADKRKRKTHE